MELLKFLIEEINIDTIVHYLNVRGYGKKTDWQKKDIQLSYRILTSKGPAITVESKDFLFLPWCFTMEYYRDVIEYLWLNDKDNE
jgi:hypothetical protein